MAFEEVIVPLTILAVFVYIIILGAYLAILVMTLVHQARRSRWVWFVLTLIFNIVLWVYWIVWIFSKEFRNKKKTRK